MEKLTTNWLVNLKLTWGTSRILTQALESQKNLCFNLLLVTKVNNVWATKVQRSSFMTLKSCSNFEEKLTCGFKNDMRNLANFHQNTWKCQNWDFDGILLSKVKRYELKIYRGVMCLDNEEWYKIWRGIDLPFQNLHEEFNKFWLEHWKI